MKNQIFKFQIFLISNYIYEYKNFADVNDKILIKKIHRKMNLSYSIVFLAFYLYLFLYLILYFPIKSLSIILKKTKLEIFLSIPLIGTVGKSFNRIINFIYLSIKYTN